MSLHLLLVRHGESTWNAARRWQGQADPPLSPLGMRQARAAVTCVPAGYEHVVASDLERARRTGELLADGLGLSFAVEPRLRERYAGPWQGLTRAEIEAGWPGMLDDGRRPDDYEPDATLLERALEALDVGSTPTIVVTHGGVIRVIERHLGFAATRIPNLSALPIDRTADGLAAGARIGLAGDGAVAAEAGG